MIENLYLLLYVAGMAFAFLDGGFRRKVLYSLSVISVFAGFAIHLFIFLRSWIATGIIPSTNAAELLDLTSLFLVFAYFSSLIVARHREIAFFLMPIVVFFVSVSTILPKAKPEIKPYFTTMWFPVHILLLVSGIGLIIFSFIYSTIFILQDYSLRKKKNPNAMPLPTIDAAEKYGRFYLFSGFVFLSFGFFSSALYGIINAKKDSSYHPGLLEAATFLSWMTLGFATYGWLRSTIKPRKRAFLVIVGASLMLFIFLGMLWH